MTDIVVFLVALALVLGAGVAVVWFVVKVIEHIVRY